MDTINKCNIHVNKSNKHKFYNSNTEAPTLRATIKIHKNPTKIRPIVNWENAPAYQLAIQTSKLLIQYIQLPYTFNVINTTQLMNELRTTTITLNTRICSSDITNMYTNIPTTQITDIVMSCMNNNNVNEDVKNEIGNLINIIIEQNYFQFNNKYYKQKGGLAMGAPTSAILSEAYLQYIEHTCIYNILQKHNIVSYHRYVDDILIIYDSTKTNINNTLVEFNGISKTLKFTIEKEQDQFSEYYNT
jgi:hypothetical protein